MMTTSVVADAAAKAVAGQWAGSLVSLLIAASALGSLCAGAMSGSRLVIYLFLIHISRTVQYLCGFRFTLTSILY